MKLSDPLHCLSFNLSRAARNLARGMEAATRESGLTAPQFSTLAVLSAQGEMSVGQLAEALGTERTTLTRNLDLLQREGLIVPAPSADRRVRSYALSAEGQERLARALPAWSAWQAQEVGRLGEDRARRLLEVLRTL